MEDNPQPRIEFERDIKFNSTLYFWNQSTNYNIPPSGELARTEFSTGGVSNTKNLNRFDIAMSHLAFKTEFGKSATIEDGTFELIGEEGHQIFGTYEGYADLSKDPLNLILFYKIEGGTGYFENASGTLSASASQDDITPNVQILELKGTIIRDKANSKTLN